MRLVLVEWTDAAGGVRGGWRPTEDMARDKPRKCRSVGWVIQDDAERLIICPHLASDGDGDGEIAIPRGWAQRIIDLTETKRRK